ncbi:MAG: hypothetical protein R3323_02130 [Wenzhouxiangellaceae bacterium]|nr:hypothetical protein [Wenzhouxiangellaceae bacterium]
MVLIEFVIVAAGILFALQVDQWSQDRSQRTLEREYLARLVEDLEIERAHMAATLRSNDNRIDAVRRLEAFARNPELAAETPSVVPWAIETVSWRAFPNINAFVFRELQSTGRLTLIRSVGLRRALAEHYAEIEHDARVGEDLSAQRRYEAAVAGLATTDELLAVENAASIAAIEIAPERALEMVEALIARPAALAELPTLAQHHAFNRRAIDDMQARTDALIEQIRLLLGQAESDG